MPIRVLQAGLLTTVQDMGRFGYAHLGISTGGAADKLSLRIANLLVGNEENAPALEMTLRGAALAFDERTFVAITGADCDLQLNGAPASMEKALEIKSGGVLQCGRMMTGARAYLAIQGGLDVPWIMGSAATDIAGHFGGFEGRKLRAGDVLAPKGGASLPPRVLKALIFKSSPGPLSLRVTRGAQQDWFSSQVHLELVSRSFTVTEQWDRRGIRLKSETALPQAHGQLLTEGVSLGALQVPPDGNPMILFVDQPTTGGYPKIANVIAADLHQVGQLRPGDQVRFEEVTIEEAVALLRKQENRLKSMWKNPAERHRKR